MPRFVKGDRSITSTIPAECVRLRAEGFREVSESPAPVAVEEVPVEVVDELPTVDTDVPADEPDKDESAPTRKRSRRK